MKKSTKEWFKSSESDLLLIKEINSNENLTHLSAFHAQQAIEKSFKAVIEEFDIGFIKTHSLETLYNIVKDKPPRPVLISCHVKTIQRCSGIEFMSIHEICRLGF
jgi:HEPN domain-containing protein